MGNWSVHRRAAIELVAGKNVNIKGGLKPKTLKKDMPDYGFGLMVMTRLYLVRQHE
jgi:hypothetical protein